jgi:hypothetical protein
VGWAEVMRGNRKHIPGFGFVFIITLVLSELGYGGERRKKLAEDDVQFVALILFWFCCI